MKKLLFAAILATVAVGGASAQYYSIGSPTQNVDCGGASNNCAAFYEIEEASTVPSSQNQQANLVPNFTELNRDL